MHINTFAWQRTLLAMCASRWSTMRSKFMVGMDIAENIWLKDSIGIRGCFPLEEGPMKS